MNPLDNGIENIDDLDLGQAAPSLNVIKNVPVNGQDTNVFFRDIGGKTPEVASKLIELVNRNKLSGGKQSQLIAAHLAENEKFFERALLLNSVEAGRIDVGAALKSFFASKFTVADAQRRHGYEIEILRAKVIASTTGIPLHKKALQQHQAYLAGNGQHPLGELRKSPIDPYKNTKGYYHIERDKNGNNVIYLNDIQAGAMVVDMDGDELTATIARKRDKSGNIIEEFMIPVKEPLLQNLPVFRNINYEKGVNFDKTKLFGKFTGLNFGDLGDRLDPDSIKSAFSNELSSRKYSVVGDFLRAYDKPESRAGFGGVRNLDAVRKYIAEKSLAANETGIFTIAHDQRAIITNLYELHRMREAEPNKYLSMLKEQQEAARAQLEILRRESNKTAKVIGGKAFGVYNAQGELIQANEETFLESMLHFSDDPTKNLNLRRKTEIDYISKHMLDDPERLDDIEVRSLKVGRNANAISRSDALSIVDTFKEYVNDPLLMRVKTITQLNDRIHASLISSLVSKTDDETFFDVTNRAFLNVNIDDIQTRKGDIEPRSPINYGDYSGRRQGTTLGRLSQVPVVDNKPLIQFQELNGFEGIVTADHLKDNINYRPAPLAITIRNAQGQVVAPQIGGSNGNDITQVSLFGNIASPSNGGVALHNRREYLATELERRLQEQYGNTRQFGDTSGELEFHTILQRLTQDSDTKRQIASSYGIDPNNIDQVNSFSRTMRQKLETAGAGSALHQEIALKYDVTHRGAMLTTIQKHLNDIISHANGLTDAAVEIDPNTGYIKAANPLDVRRVSARYGLDVRGQNLSPEVKTDTIMQALHSFGGFISKNTSSGSDRYMQMAFGSAPGDIRTVGMDLRYFTPLEQAKRQTDIQRQMAGGIRLGKARMVLADTEIPLEYFRMTDPNASMGLKRPDEGVILMSRSFRDRSIEQIKTKLQIGPTLTQDKLGGSMEDYVAYMLGDRQLANGRRLTRLEEQHLRTKFQKEFMGMWDKKQIGGNTIYHLNEKGMDTTLNRVFKMGSLFGDKAVVHTVDDMRDAEGKLIDVLMHINQARSRGNEIPRYQQVLQTAINEGRLSIDDLGEEFRAGARGGLINFEEVFEKHGHDQDTFLSRIKTGFIDPLEKVQQNITLTDRGTTQAFRGLVAETDDFFAAGNYGDVYKSFKETNLTSRTLGRPKLLGKIANALDDEFGNNIAGIGAQFIFHAMGSFAKQMSEANVVGTGIKESFSAAEIINSSRQVVRGGREAGRALQDSLMNEAGIPKL